MFRIKGFISVLFLFMATFSLQAQASSEDQSLQSLIEEHSIVGVVSGFSVDGEIIWNNTMGYADKKKNVVFTESTLTRIASLAKPMTAIAIMQLVEKGLLNLDEPIQTYIPQFPKKKKTAITTRMLLSHTSGVKGYKNGKEANNKKSYNTMLEAMNVFVDRKLEFEPGSGFLYSSYGYVVLGVLIEKVSGMSYEEYMQQHIWSIAEMDNTGIEYANKRYKNKSKIYHLEKNKIEEIASSDLSNRIPGGGFYSTWVDLLKFGDAVVNNKLISEETLYSMIQVSFNKTEGNKYSFGWFLHGKKGNESGVIGHGGGQLGANAQLFIIPKKKVVAITLANTSGTGNAVVIHTFELLKKGIELTMP